MIFGELDGSRSPRLEWLLEACRPAGFQATLSTDITVEIWTKFVRLSVFSGMTAVTRSPIGVIRDDPELFAMLKTAVKEAMAVAQAKGVAVPEQLCRVVALIPRPSAGRRDPRCSRISSAAGRSSCRG